MRKQLTGGVAALLTMLSMSVFTNSTGSAVGTKTVNHINTLAALSGVAAPDVEDSSAADYLTSVCGQGVYHWQENKMPIKVCISSGAGVPGFRPQFAGMVRHAFSTWAAASGDKLSWKEVKSPSEADVNVGWTDQVTQRATGTEAGETNAYTQLNKATGQGIIYGAKMSLLTELPEKQFTDNDMAKTILHETGHALGLQGHSPVRTDIMYYAINADQQPALTSRDEATMAHLYADYPSTDKIAKAK
ncbi:MAG TPA: matrixin family metalloprotease [Candidatus Obscuribacterales bacterium]